MAPACRTGRRTPSGTNFQRMRLDVDSRAEPEPHRDRYLVLDAVFANR